MKDTAQFEGVSGEYLKKLVEKIQANREKNYLSFGIFS